eukprot:2003143-Lingulodinium_polyedra.AAC.1
MAHGFLDGERHASCCFTQPPPEVPAGLCLGPGVQLAAALVDIARVGVEAHVQHALVLRVPHKLDEGHELASID